MLRHSISRRVFVAAIAVGGAGIATNAFADAPDVPDLPESAELPEAAEMPETTEVPEPAPAEAELTLYREWLLEDISGGGVIDRLQLTLQVAEDGSVSGHGGCNRFAGQAEIGDDSLSFGPLAATRMACGEAQMNQEQKYFDALDKVASFSIDQATRKLVLSDGEGQAVLTYASME